MNRNLALGLAALTMLGAGTIFVSPRPENAPPRSAGSAATASRGENVVAGPGRVEPVSEEIEVSAAVSGRLQAVLVDEGYHIQRGQMIAELENADYRARVASAEAALRERQAELRRVVNGARGQERRQALAQVKEAQAVLENARTELSRRQAGYRQGVFAREEADQAEREFGVAKSRYDAAAERYALVNDEAREEDRSRAEAEVALARAQLNEARALYEKTLVRSPITGVVLRRHLKGGESVSTQFASPIVMVADDSRLRVRMDVDETDVGKIQLGQSAYVTADAFPGKKFWGRVVRVGQLLGKKNIRTDEPAERVDAKILETLVELDDNCHLPLGLRVDAFVLVEVGTGMPTSVK